MDEIKYTITSELLDTDPATLTPTEFGTGNESLNFRFLCF